MSKERVTKKVKVSKKSMEMILQEFKTQGIDISKFDTEKLKDKGIVSSDKRISKSFQIKDKEGNYFRPSITFKSVIDGKKIRSSNLMNEFREEFEGLKKTFCEEISTEVKINLNTKKKS